MNRSPHMIIGIILVILGTAALIWPWISYTEKETIVDVGAVTVTAETRKSLPIPPILGGLALAGGVALIIAGSRKGRLP